MRPILLLLALLPLAACDDAPVLPTEQPDRAASAVMAPACTKTWIDLAGGSWRDATNWLPASVPTLYNVACLTMPGTYEVTIDSTVSVGSIVIGATAANATLTFTGELGNRMGIGDEVIVEAGSEFAIHGVGFSIEIGGAITNHGTIRIVEDCACSWAGALDLHNSFATPTHRNYGLLDISDALVLWLDPGVTFENYGTIAVNGDYPSSITVTSDAVAVGATIAMLGGTITGSQPLEIDGAWGVDEGDERRFVWTGGTLETLSGDSSAAIVYLSEMDIILSNTALDGRLDLVDANGWDTRIDGDIGPNVHLHIRKAFDAFIEFTNASGVVVNSGRIDVVADQLFPGDITLSFPALVNDGILTVRNADLVPLELDSLINTGLLAGNSDMRLETTLARVRNEGTIAFRGAALRAPTLTTFESVFGSSMTGTLVLDGGTLTGDGTLGRIVAIDGTIQPGAPIGTLSAQTLLIGPRSALAMEVAGTAAGEHDLIAVAGNVVYDGGTLAIISLPPYLGGSCGEVVTIITDSASVLRNEFSKLVGLVPGPLREWRLHRATDALQLAGFNPVAPIFANPDSVTAVEAGAQGSYAVCLGRAEPIADVVVTATRGTTEIEVAPRTLTFDTVNWQLPQFITVVAINDTDVEGDHADVVDHAIATTDPYYATAYLRAVDVGIVDDDGATSSATAATSTRRHPFTAPPTRVPPVVVRIRHAGGQDVSGSGRRRGSG